MLARRRPNPVTLGKRDTEDQYQRPQRWHSRNFCCRKRDRCQTRVVYSGHFCSRRAHVGANSNCHLRRPEPQRVGCKWVGIGRSRGYQRLGIEFVKRVVDAAVAKCHACRTMQRLQPNLSGVRCCNAGVAYRYGSGRYVARNDVARCEGYACRD